MWVGLHSSTRSQTYAVQEATVKHPSEASLCIHPDMKKPGMSDIRQFAPVRTSRISGRPLAVQHHPDCICKDNCFPLVFIILEHFSLRVRVFARTHAPDKYGVRIMRAQYCARAPRRYRARIMPAWYRTRLDKSAQLS